MVDDTHSKVTAIGVKSMYVVIVEKFSSKVPILDIDAGIITSARLVVFCDADRRTAFRSATEKNVAIVSRRQALAVLLSISIG